MLQNQPNQLCYVAEMLAEEGKNYRIKAKQCLPNMVEDKLISFLCLF